MSSSAVAESGLNTRSGENAGAAPHALMVEEIHSIRGDFKKAAKRAVEAGADGIEASPFLSSVFHDCQLTRTIRSWQERLVNRSVSA